MSSETSDVGARTSDCAHPLYESGNVQTWRSKRDEHAAKGAFSGDFSSLGGRGVERHLRTANGDGTFDPEAVRVLTAALDDAWRSLQISGAYFKSLGHAEATRERLALRIIEMAMLGERDPARLSEDALLHLAQSNLAQLKSRATSL